jgi:crotonobetainyl-CoA:carnitine CoA-transferase CaiB-like acyl-CoA transferase
MADGALAHAVMPLRRWPRTEARGAPVKTHSPAAWACYALYRTADDRFLAIGALERKVREACALSFERADLEPLHRTRRRHDEAHVRN